VEFRDEFVEEWPDSDMSKVLAMAARVAASHYGPDPGRTPYEELVGSGLPGDTHGRLIDPEPFKGMGLSKNPKPRISPQTMPETIYRDYTGASLTYPHSAPSSAGPSSGGSRKEKESPGLRAVVRRT
jgi:hypothetical protein